jgi:hypothetical protein
MFRKRYQITNKRSETANLFAVLLGNIARHTQGFQEYFRGHHGAAEIHNYAVFQVSNYRGKSQKIVV